LVEPNKYANLDWKKLPPGSAKPMTPELKAEIARREAHVEAMQAQYDAETKSNPEFYNPKTESNQMIRTNVADLDAVGVQTEIDIVTKIIQSGESETRDFHAGNGDEATTSIHKYLYWLQQRAHALEGDGTYSPDMFGLS
jgi:hypothetical protein